MTKNEEKKVTVVFRYNNFNDYIRDYTCWEWNVPKVGDIVYLLQNYGTVASVEKKDNFTYLCSITENNTECVTRLLNEQLNSLLEDTSTCKTIEYICNVEGKLELEIDNCLEMIDQGSTYPKSCIAYKLPWLTEYIPTEVEYTLENLRALKCVLMERFHKVKDVVFVKTITTKEKIYC